MTLHQRYALLGQADGRLPKATAAEEVWRLASHRKAAPMWIAFAMFVVLLILMPFFSNEPMIKLSAEEAMVADAPSVQAAAPPPPPPPPPPPADADAAAATELIDFSVGGCNIWRGDWIPHAAAPPYTNETCPYIQENQNCIKLGRPDHQYLYWRWKPYECELPLFDAEAFLKIVTGKKWAFIGDSLARNSFQSVVCHLAQVEAPECTFNDGKDGNVHWYFRSYNFTLAVLWAPFYIKGFENSEIFGPGIADIHLDVVDESWAPWLHNYDYILLSAARWFLRTSVYYVKGKIVGCNKCPTINATDVGFPYGYGAALRTVFDFLISSNYKGVVFFRTFSPEHWEHGAWDQGGNCTKKVPSKSWETPLDGLSYHMYKVQLEEFGKTLQRSSEYSFKLKIVDTLYAALLRPDAHPGPYGHFHPRAKYDCVHWCLPGAVDAWSDMILHILKHVD